MSDADRKWIQRRHDLWSTSEETTLIRAIPLIVVRQLVIRNSNCPSTQIRMSMSSVREDQWREEDKTFIDAFDVTFFVLSWRYSASPFWQSTIRSVDRTEVWTILCPQSLCRRKNQIVNYVEVWWMSRTISSLLVSISHVHKSLWGWPAFVKHVVSTSCSKIRSRLREGSENRSREC